MNWSLLKPKLKKPCFVRFIQNNVVQLMCTFFPTVLTDWVGTFRWVNMTFSSTYEVVTTTIQLRNISSITSFPWNQMFTLFTINYPCVFRFYINRIDTFKQINVELQIFKLSKIEYNIKVCTIVLCKIYIILNYVPR